MRKYIVLVADKQRMRKYVVVVAALALIFVAGPAFAQTPDPTAVIPTLAIDSYALQSGLFQGANIILVALGAVMFIIIGMTFGGRILSAIQSAITSFRL